VNTLTISRNQSLELRLTRNLRRTNTPEIYRTNDFDKQKSIASESEHTPSNATNSAVQDDNTAIDIELPAIPIEINNEEDISQRFSFYEEEESIIIEDETNGKVYVVNNSPSPTTTPATDSGSQKNNFNLFPMFKKSSKEQIDR
jgi:hypothetical protein